MSTYSIHEAKTHFSRLVRKALDGEEVIIANRERPLLKLTPLRPPRRENLLGDLKGRVQVRKDFDEPLEDFAEYQ